MNLLYAQTGLQLLERYLLRLRVEVQHNNKLESHHRCKEQKREAAGRVRPQRKSSEMRAFMIQCVELPRLWPFARTRVGKTSLR